MKIGVDKLMTSNDVFKKCTDQDTWDKIIDFDNVSKMWENSVKLYANLPAIVDGETITYKELDDKVKNFRAVLSENGVGVGDMVGIYMPNSSSFVVSYLAITTLGAVAVLLPPQLDETALFGCSIKYSLKVICYHQSLKEKITFTSQKNPGVVLIDHTATSKNNANPVFVDKKAPCMVIFTGGTTGKNKGALLSNQAVMVGTKNGCFGTKDVFNQRYFLVLPLTHVFGLIRNLLTTLYTGSVIFICRNNKDMFKEIAVFKPTIMVLVPALAEMALNLSKQFNRNLLGDDLKTIICGAAAVPPYLIKEYNKLGVSLLAGYGMTESANLISGNCDSLDFPESVGYFYGGMEYKIVDGELWIKGDNLFDGYWGEPEENKASFMDGWFKTGDLVRIDEGNRLYIVGRNKEVIVLPSGKKISPAEIEYNFLELDTVQDCLVYLDEDEMLTLEVLPRTAVTNALNVANIEEFLKEQINNVNDKLPSYLKINKIIIRTTDFIRSPSMKIVRNQNGNAKK